MSKFFDFLKSASKAIDDVEHVVGKVTQLAGDVSAHMAQSETSETTKPKSYAMLLNQYRDSLEPGGPGMKHSFDAYLFKPPFNVTYTLPDAASYTDEGDYGAGEIYHGYSYRNYETANLFYAIDLGTQDVKEADLLAKFSKFNGPMTVLEYRRLSDPHFDIRMELANEKAHTILYIHGLEPGNWFFAECDIYKNKLDERTQVKIMKDFEDMVAGIEYSGKLLDPSFLN